MVTIKAYPLEWGIPYTIVTIKAYPLEWIHANDWMTTGPWSVVENTFKLLHFSACLVWHGAVTPKLHQAGSAVLPFYFAFVCASTCACVCINVPRPDDYLRCRFSGAVCPLYGRVFSPSHPGWLTVEPRDPLATCASPGLQEHASTSGFGFSFNIGLGAWAQTLIPSLYQPSHLPSSLVSFGLQGNSRVQPVWAKKSSSEQKMTLNRFKASTLWLMK